MIRPIHEVAKLFATAVARTMTPAELERVAQALERVDPEDLESGGDGVGLDILAIVKQERRNR